MVRFHWQMGRRKVHSHWLIGTRVVRAHWLIGRRVVSAHWLIGRREVRAHRLIGRRAVRSHCLIGRRVVRAHWLIGRRVVRADWLIGRRAVSRCSYLGQFVLVGAVPVKTELQGQVHLLLQLLHLQRVRQPRPVCTSMRRRRSTSRNKNKYRNSGYKLGSAQNTPVCVRAFIMYVCAHACMCVWKPLCIMRMYV